MNLLIPVALSTAGITFFLVGSILRAHRGRVRTGGAAMIGTEAVALADFVARDSQYAGMVRAHGEIWQAVSPITVRAGQSLTIAACDGLTLHVQPVAHPNSVESPGTIAPAPPS